MKKKNTFGLILLLSMIILSSCKKDDTSFYEYSSPSFITYKLATEPESIFAYCLSHDIYLDSVRVTSPIDLKYHVYYQGKYCAQEVHFLLGDNFIQQAGTWSFIYYGRKTINNIPFSVYSQTDF